MLCVGVCAVVFVAAPPRLTPHSHSPGMGFIDNPLLACRFGTVLSPEVVFVSPTRVICAGPPHELGRGDVSVANNGQQWSKEQLVVRHTPAVQCCVSCLCVLRCGCVLCAVCCVLCAV